jgi:hypothetical protein
VPCTTNWDEFPRRWSQLLDEVYRFVRGREELATGGGTERWRNVMLYKDDTPDVEVGVLAARSFEPEGRVIPSLYPAVRPPPRSTAATTPASAPPTTRSVPTSQLVGAIWPARGGRSTGTGGRIRTSSRTDVFWLLR